jgi:hypothetical protein
MNQVGPLFAPDSSQFACGWKPHADFPVAGNAKARHGNDAQIGITRAFNGLFDTRSVNCNMVSPTSKLLRDYPEGHGDAIDLGRESFGDDCDPHSVQDKYPAHEY